MSECIQIRRAIKPTEFIPVFDTAFLLAPDYCFLPIVDFKKMPVPNIGSKESADRARKAFVEKCFAARKEKLAQYGPKIKKMLDQGLPVTEMVELLDVKKSFIYSAINELRLKDFSTT